MKHRPIDKDIGKFVHYDPVVGIFMWKASRSRGARIGTFVRNRANGYLRIKFRGKDYRANRVAWFLVTGDDPGAMEVDHRNGVETDDRFENFRLATHGQNMANSRRRKDNVSGFKGVSFSKKDRCYYAFISINGKSVNLGGHATKEAAAAAYRAKAAEVRGEFARVA